MSNEDDHAQIEELNCPICQEPYDDDEKNPRNLPCGHTFCSSCLELILDDEIPLCPECRTEIISTAVDDFPISYIVKKMIASYKNIYAKMQNEVLLSAQNSVSNPEDEGNSASYDSDASSATFLSIKASPTDCSNELIPSNDSCSSHQSPKTFFCHTCGIWICGACAFLEHKEKCDVAFVTDQVGIMKINAKHKIKRQRDIMTEAIKKLEGLKVHTLDLYGDGSAPIDHVDNISALLLEIQENLSEIDSSWELFDDVIEMFQENTLQAMEALTTSVDNLFEIQEYPKSLQDFLWNLWPFFRKSINLFNSDTHKICITTELRGKTLYSNLEEVDIYILIPSFEEANCSQVQDKYPLSLKHICEKTTVKHTFMEFCHRNETKYLGRVIFSIFDSPRGDLFLDLCSGMHGNSYKATHFFYKGGSSIRFLEGGDYENDDGTGGKSLTNIDGDIHASLHEGVVCGPDRHRGNILGQFKICYHLGLQEADAYGPMAKIDEGLDIIKSIVNMDYDEYKNVFISECGLCIPK